VDEAAIKKKLNELSEAMAMRSSASTKGAAEGVYYPQISTEAGSVSDSLDQLRLQVKYLIFDLEATRRENRYLRGMLENRRRPKSGDSQEGPNDL